MSITNAASIALLLFGVAQGAQAGSMSQQLPPKTTLPIIFTRNVDASHAHVGDLVLARTTQEVQLAGGLKVPSGSQVSGHVVESTPFAFDSTPYAKQKRSTLAIHFETVSLGAVYVPLNVYVRAMADPVASSDPARPVPNDDSAFPSSMLIGGDLVSMGQAEVLSRDGDVVGYKRHGGVYAHLISASGNAPDVCDASDTEESMGSYSASACGLYGFTGNVLEQTGKGSQPSTLVIASSRQSPKIWKNSTALLEVLPSSEASAPR